MRRRVGIIRRGTNRGNLFRVACAEAGFPAGQSAREQFIPREQMETSARWRADADGRYRACHVAGPSARGCAARFSSVSALFHPPSSPPPVEFDCSSTRDRQYPRRHCGTTADRCGPFSFVFQFRTLGIFRNARRHPRCSRFIAAIDDPCFAASRRKIYGVNESLSDRVGLRSPLREELV